MTVKPQKPLTPEQIKALLADKDKKKITGQTITKDEPGNTKPEGQRPS